jgi:hypothetical protein
VGLNCIRSANKYLVLNHFIASSLCAVEMAVGVVSHADVLVPSSSKLSSIPYIVLVVMVCSKFESNYPGN